MRPTVKIQMVFWSLWGPFCENDSKIDWIPQGLQGFLNHFFRCCRLLFPHWKGYCCRCRESASGWTEEPNAFNIVLSLCRRMPPKVCINDGLYIVVNNLDDVAKCCFPIGKVTFADVAKAHQVWLRNLMLFEVFWCHFAQTSSKSLHKRQCL